MSSTSTSTSAGGEGAAAFLEAPSVAIALAHKLPMAAATVLLFGVVIGCCCSAMVFSRGNTAKRRPPPGAIVHTTGRAGSAAKLTICLGGGLAMWLLGGSVTLMLHWCSSSAPLPVRLDTLTEPSKVASANIPNLRAAAAAVAAQRDFSDSSGAAGASVLSGIEKPSESPRKALPFQAPVNRPSSVLARFRHCFPHQSCPEFVSHGAMPRFPKASYVWNRNVAFTEEPPRLPRPKLSKEDAQRFEHTVRYAKVAPADTGHFLEGDRRADPAFSWASEDVADLCMARTSSDTIDQQLATALNAWEERKESVASSHHPDHQKRVPIVFTLVDVSYLDMLDEMWDTVHAKGDMGRRFLFVSLDEPTTKAACAAGYPVIYASASLTQETTKQRVYRAKYGIAVSLLGAKEDFLFLEMDVWPRTDLLPIFAPPDSTADLTLMLHQDNPFVINIGIYFVRANPRTWKLFDTMEKYLIKYDGAFDQDLFNCIVKPHSVVRFFLSRINCEYDGIVTKDPMLVELNNLMNGSATFDVVQPNVALSHDTPSVMADTTAVHILTNRPLTSSHGKKTIAKELYLWHGAHCYYCVGGGGRDPARPNTWRRPRGRYLMYASTLGSLRPPTWHSAEYILGALINLVALAILTDRVLVLPPVYFHEKIFASWEWFDVLDIRKLVQWREATFFSNPKLKYFPPPEEPDRTDPTVAMLHFGMEEILFGNVTVATEDFISPTLRWPNPIVESQASPKDIHTYKENIWAAAMSEETGARDADVLVVDFTTGQDVHEEVCFFRKMPACNIKAADELLRQLYAAMRFCDFQDGYISKRQTKGWLAHMDCRTRNDMWKAVRGRQRSRASSGGSGSAAAPKQEPEHPKSLSADKIPVQPTWGSNG